MIYRNLYVNLIVRVILITLTCILLSFAFFRFRDWLIFINIMALLVLQVIFFIRYMNRLNHDLYNFFSAIRNDDSSIIYERMAPSKSFIGLYKCFDDINHKIRNLKIETVNRNLYLQNLIEHVGIGLMSFDSNGNVEIINSAARNLLQIPPVKNINRLEKIDKSLPDKLRQLPPGSQLLINYKTDNELLKIAVRASLFRIAQKEIKLLSFQNIKNELEENELDSYHKLIRILTHEIMNSTGPILSSISTIKEILTEQKTGNTKKLDAIVQELLDDTVKGLNIIEDRSGGLAEFVEKFRSLTLLPKPTFTRLSVSELLKNIEILMSKNLKYLGINFSIEVIPENLFLNADKKLIEQVIINLINNSAHALESCRIKKIWIKAFRNPDEKVIMQVSDNGIGIPEAELENIFIPFYTTKEKGSGIGLSLSRQIMRMHNGKITVLSQPGIETTFILEF